MLVVLAHETRARLLVLPTFSYIHALVVSMVMRHVASGCHATSAAIPFLYDVIVARRAPGVALCDDTVHVQTHCDVIVCFRLAPALGAGIRFPLVAWIFYRVVGVADIQWGACSVMATTIINFYSHLFTRRTTHYILLAFVAFTRVFGAAISIS